MIESDSYPFFSEFNYILTNLCQDCKKSAYDRILTRQLYQTPVIMSYNTHLPISEINASPHYPSFNLLEVEHVAIKVREDVSLKELLLTVERELL